MPSRISTEKRTKSVPEGVWVKCAACDGQLYRNELERNLHVCPKCDFHMRIGARQRLGFFLDPDSIQELAAGQLALHVGQSPDLQLLHVLDFLFEDDEDDLHGTDDDVVTLFGPLLVKML